MARISAMVVDGDKTLWQGRTLEGVFYAYMRKELAELRLPTFYKVVCGACEVKTIVKQFGGNVEGEAKGQKRAYGVLIENGLGKKEELYSFAKDFIDKRVVRNVSDLVMEKKRAGAAVFLSTASGTTTGEYIMERFHLRDFVSNKEFFDGKGRLMNVELVITNGENKLAATVAMLDKYNITLDECVVIGDSRLDIPMLQSAGFPMASPFATDEVKAIRGITQIRRN